MREVIGIVVGILGFVLIATHAVKQHGTAPLSQGKIILPSSPPPSALPMPPTDESAVSPPTTPSTGKESSAPPVSLPSPVPAMPMTIRLAEHPVASVPLSHPNSHPNKVIYFQSGCTGLSRSDQTALKDLLPVLRKSPNARIEIHGHTDDRGHTQSNLDLSRLRADIVHYYLQSQGIAESRFTVGGYGSSSPVTGNESATGRRRNRRTEIIIHRESLRDS